MIAILRKVARVLAVAVPIVLAIVFWRERPRDARAAKVDRGEVRAEATGTGTVESDDEIAIAFTMPGRIASLAVDEGDRVAAGQALGTLDVADVAKELAVARANEQLASVAIERANADVARARVVLDAAEKDLARTIELARAGSVGEARLDDAKALRDRAHAELRAAIAGVTQASSATRVARETSASRARRLDDGKVTSPVDGVVVKRLHAVGDVVGSGATVLVVASSRKVRVRAWIDETVLASLHEGGDAHVVVRSEPDRALRAEIERIGLEADRQTHEVLVDVLLRERPARIAFGQRADVFLTLDARAAVTRAPIGYCDLGSKSCLVERGGRVRRANVSFGLVGADWVEIKDGLVDGDVVLAAPADAPLPVGSRVRRAGS